MGLEIPVDGYNAESWNGVTDYCLYQPNGEVIAVVEAKRKQWEEIMEVSHKYESGQLPAKTIVFALTQKHALRLCATFEEMYPSEKVT